MRKILLLLLVILILTSCGSDDNSPQDIQTCNGPANVQIQDVGLTSAAFIWDGNNDTVWQIEYGETGFTQGNGTIIDIATNFITINGLSQNTTYDAYIRSICTNGTESNWIWISSFSTTLDCHVPSNIEVLDIQNTSATITWEPANFSEEVVIEYGPTGFSMGSGTVVSETSNSLTIESLAENTSYDYYIRTKCVDQMFSPWSDVQNFTTLLNCLLPTDVEIIDIQGTNATITWESANFSEEVEIEYGPTGFSIGNGTTLTETSNSLTIADLSINTSYDFYLRTKCVNDSYSEWSNVFSLTTTNCIGDSAGSVVLQTQQDVDNFNYSTVNGQLIIGRPLDDDSLSDITDLSSLSCLTNVNGLLIRNNPNLQTLNGLDNLSEIGASFDIINNSALLSIENLNNLTSVGHLVDYMESGIIISTIKNNPSLLTINLPNLTLVRTLVINNCASLTSIEYPLIELLITLRIIDTPQLTNINFQNANRFGGVGLAGGYGGVRIDNTSLTSLSTFNNVSSSTGSVIINNNPLLEYLDGFTNISGPCYYISIANNDSLINIDELSNLSGSITGNFSAQVINNNSLLNVDGLISRTLFNNITISNNNSLSNIEGLSNITNCYINSTTGLTINDNPLLTDFCSITNHVNINQDAQFACDFTISNNGYNPTEQDILDGNCSQ